MTTATAPNFTLARTFDAPCSLVYEAFTNPDHFAAWWGPIGNLLPRDEIEADVRPGGHLQWKELFPAQPGTWTIGRFDLTDVVVGELLEGTMSINGNLPGGFEPFQTRLRIEFHVEADGRTRLDVSQWLPEHLVSPTDNGWAEAFSKLDMVLGRAAS